MAVIRLGIVGVGALGLRVLAHLAQDDVRDRVRVQAVCDPVVERARATAEQYGVPRSFADLDAMLADGEVDAVTIASPIGLHYEQGLKAVLAGKHVHRLTAPGGRPIDPSWYFKKPGGGPMYDMTVYALHKLTSVLGPAKRVTAFSGQAVARREFQGTAVEATADDNTIGILDFGDDRYAVIYGTPNGLPTSEVGGVRYFGTSGVIDGLLLNGEPFDFPGSDYVRSAGNSVMAQKTILPHTVGVHRELMEPHVFEDVMQLVDWVRDGKPSPVTAEHARHVVDIIESAYRSAETGKAEALRTSFDW